MSCVIAVHGALQGEGAFDAVTHVLCSSSLQAKLELQTRRERARDYEASAPRSQVASDVGDGALQVVGR